MNLAEVYYGISMQMLTYLDVVITHAPWWLGSEALPAGVLYFHVHDPMLQAATIPEEKERNNKLFKKFKMNGLVLADEEAVTLMDKEMVDRDSDIIPAAFKKNGGFKAYSKIVSEDEFAVLQTHTRRLIRYIGTKLTDGIIDISPYKMNKQTACTFCSFRSFCQFDQSLAENRYRLLKAEKNDDIFEKMGRKKRDG